MAPFFAVLTHCRYEREIEREREREKAKKQQHVSGREARQVSPDFPNLSLSLFSIIFSAAER